MLYIGSLLLVAIPALIVLLCRVFPAVAQWWITCAFSPVAGALSKLSGLLEFPVAEPMFLLVAALAVYLLIRSRRGLLLLISSVFAIYALMWVPIYFASDLYNVGIPADSMTVKAVCEGLIGELNAYGEFSMPEDLPKQALEVAQLISTPAVIEAVPKFARYPEWMRSFRLAGLYVPWTFEALLSPDEGEAGIPFTAVHELMHLGGIADEGQANIAAYEACVQKGGAFGYSAKLWALKYTLGSLKDADYSAWADCVANLFNPARTHFLSINGFASSMSSTRGHATEAFLRINGMAEKADNYGALAVYLCGH